MSSPDKYSKGAKGLAGLTVPELRNILKDAGEPYTGKRAELCDKINRLNRGSSSKRAKSPNKRSPLKYSWEDRYGPLPVIQYSSPRSKSPSPMIRSPTRKNVSSRSKSPSPRIRSPTRKVKVDNNNVLNDIVAKYGLRVNFNDRFETKLPKVNRELRNAIARAFLQNDDRLVEQLETDLLVLETM